MSNYLDLSIKEIHSALLKGETTPLELTKEAIKRAKANKDNAFECLCEEKALLKALELSKVKVPEDKIMFGIPYVAKDNFSTKGIETTGGSDILKGYIPLFNATVINLLEENGAILIGKATLDELAMGGTGTTGHKGITFNPYDKTHTRLIGGSSCGSAVAVSDAIVPFALGSDTGDSVRKPASNAGLVGYKPTWGQISRFGLFPFAPSLDHVAYFTRSVEDAALMFNVLSKHDENDSTSSFKTRLDDYSKLDGNLKGKKFVVLKEVYDSITDKVIKDKFDLLLNKIKEGGSTVDFVEFGKKLLMAIYPSYIVISSAEATSNNANLDGIKFGPFYKGNTYQDVMMQARTKGFSPLIKRRFVIGSYSLMSENQEEVFKRAQKVRHLIVDRAKELYKKYDSIICPASPSIAPLVKGASNQLNDTYLIADNWLAIGNFGGFPSITIPLGFEDDMPFGVNITSDAFKDFEVFNEAFAMENILGYRDLSVLNFKDKEGK